MKRERHKLRYYQAQACRAVVSDWEQGKTPCISVMTALGKSLINAALVEWAVKKGLRTLTLVPTMELVQQNYDECFKFISTPTDLGIVCGQLHKKQHHAKQVIAMYTSFYSLRAVSGSFDVLLIDEAHLVSNNPDSQYRKIIKSLKRINPCMLIMGMTASPYRLGQGLLINKCLKGEPVFDSIPYDTSVDPGISKLIEEGFLAPLEIVNTVSRVNLDGVKMSGLEYSAKDAGTRFELIIDDAVPETEKGFIEHGIESALIFVSSIANGHHVMERWQDKESIRFVSSDTSTHERKQIIDWLKNGTGKRYVVNVGVLTTGFNFPALQCIVLLRATTSPGLLIQMLGRLIRPYGDMVGKVFDYGTNVERLGGIDDIKVPKQRTKKGDPLTKLCLVPKCGTPNPVGLKKCRKCGAEFINDDETGLYSMRTKAQALAEKLADNTVTYDLQQVQFSITQAKTGEDMLVMYFYSDYQEVHRQFICLNHTGVAQQIAKSFVLKLFKDSRDFYKIGSVGVNVENMFTLLTDHPHYFKTVKSITLEPDGRFKKLKSIGWL